MSPGFCSRFSLIGLCLIGIISFPGANVHAATAAISIGGVVNLSVTAQGTAPFAYQWYKNGSALIGATAASYAINSFQSNDSGTYAAVISNASGSTTSDDAILTLTDGTIAPAFTTQPASQTVTIGSAVTFTAAASGTPAPTFQWQKNGVAIPGATAASLLIASAASTDAGSYTVVATNSAGGVTSGTAVLTVNSPAMAPLITTQPLSTTVTAGSGVTFMVAASGSPAPSYQWKKGGIAINGATSVLFTIGSTVSGDAGTYTVVATNSAGSATSSGAVLTVNSAPVFTTQPTAQTVQVGSSVTLKSAASGVPTPTYQWRKDGVAINGATGASYTIASAAAADAGSFTVVATNSVGSATSSSAVLTVNANLLPVITNQPASQSVIANAAVTFSVTAAGSPTLTYQWKKDGQVIAKATKASYSITRVTSKNAGTYSVVVTNAAGSVVSSGAVLAILSAPPSLSVLVDFNRDGQSDIVWQNETTGERSIWLMAGASVGSVVSLGTQALEWKLAGAGDFNKDGQSDLIWQNVATSERTLWLMNGTAVSQVVSLGNVSLDWELVGAGDFNKDGQSDLVWQNNVTGERRLWLMSGTSVSSTVSLGVIATDWDIVGTGDFNGDSQSDLILQNHVTTETGIWLMNGTARATWATISSTSSAGVIAGAGDFNNDGQSDLLWQDPLTGACNIWLMNGTKVASVRSLGTVAPEWSMQN